MNNKLKHLLAVSVFGLFSLGFSAHPQAQTVVPQFDCSNKKDSTVYTGYYIDNGMNSSCQLKIQSIYLPSDFGAAPMGRIQNLYLQVWGNPSEKDTLPFPQHLRIRMGYTERSVFPNTAATHSFGTFDTFLTTSMTTVVNRDTSVWPKNLKYAKDGDWVKIPVNDSSFIYMPGQNMVVELYVMTPYVTHFMTGACSSKSSRWGNRLMYGKNADTGLYLPDTARYGGGWSGVVSMGFDLTPTSVTELSNIRGIGLFPNPAPAGRFNLSLDAKQAMREVTVVVHDVTGREVLSRQYTNPGKSLFEAINLGNASPGIYFVRITADDEVFSRRLSVE